MMKLKTLERVDNSFSLPEAAFYSDASNSEVWMHCAPDYKAAARPMNVGTAIVLSILLGASAVSVPQGILVANQSNSSYLSVPAQYEMSLSSDLPDGDDVLPTNDDFEVESPTWLQQSIAELEMHGFVRLHDPRLAGR